MKQLCTQFIFLQQNVTLELVIKQYILNTICILNIPPIDGNILERLGPGPMLLDPRFLLKCRLIQ